MDKTFISLEKKSKQITGNIFIWVLRWKERPLIYLIIWGERIEKSNLKSGNLILLMVVLLHLEAFHEIFNASKSGTLLEPPPLPKGGIAIFKNLKKGDGNSFSKRGVTMVTYHLLSRERALVPQTLLYAEKKYKKFTGSRILIFFYIILNLSFSIFVKYQKIATLHFWPFFH